MRVLVACEELEGEIAYRDGPYFCNSEPDSNMTGENMDKIEARAVYPYAPGYRASSTGDTAMNAAIGVAEVAPKHMDIIFRDIESHGPSTPMEVAERTGILHQSCRARCSQMGQLKRLQDSGARRPDVGGRLAIVWEIAEA
jgi:hypothetical protein